MELWDSVLETVKGRVSEQNFEVWFRPTSQKARDGSKRTLSVRVPNKHFKYWLSKHYRDIIEEALAEAGAEGYQVQYALEGDDQPISPQAADGGEGGGEVSAPLKGLNPKYNFSDFVVGSCNQFAHAASVAVAEQPATAYNPLFIYGGVGLGKTHLMHAIGHTIHSVKPSLQLTYMSSERFMNELINAIRYDQTPQFREKYRSIDVLLMDDIQFLAGKERTQEEFFHTFNALYDTQKQIVISSDSPPKEIPSLEERLHSRFEWGLIADIQPPDLETKMAILAKKAAAEEVGLAEDVCFYIANNTKSNVRELEGALVRLVAYSSLTGEEISLKLAQKVLKPLADPSSRPVTVPLIQKAVADHFSLKVTDLKAKTNARRISYPRQVAMYLCKELTDHSLPQIGRDFGGKHHTTVLHAVRKIKKQRAEDRGVEQTLNRLLDLL
ncbi:MAG TPA: chromosomal replication initiator protein DnaA [Acidobacteriota bacterium]|nr:chromosomal replication initiator protein DnaA [Acidobacteriota bacterium]